MANKKFADAKKEFEEKIKVSLALISGFFCSCLRGSFCMQVVCLLTVSFSCTGNMSGFVDASFPQSPLLPLKLMMIDDSPIICVPNIAVT